MTTDETFELFPPASDRPLHERSDEDLEALFPGEADARGSARAELGPDFPDESRDQGSDRT